MDVSPLVPWLHPRRGLLVYRNPVHAHEGGTEKRIHDYVMRSRQVYLGDTLIAVSTHIAPPWNRAAVGEWWTERIFEPPEPTGPGSSSLCTGKNTMSENQVLKPTEVYVGFRAGAQDPWAAPAKVCSTSSWPNPEFR